jgi:PKD repeat protein
MNDVALAGSSTSGTSARTSLSTCLRAVLFWTTLAGATSAQLTADFTATPTSGVNALSVSFTDTTTGGRPNAWFWVFGDGGFSVLQNPTHTFMAPGSYSVSLTAVAGQEEDSIQKVDLITVDPAAFVADFRASPTQGINPLQVAFTDTSTGATLTSWSWDFGDGSTSVQQNPTHTYTTLGLHTVTLTALVGQQGDTIVKTDLITVDPAALVVDFSASPVVGAQPLDVTFSDLSSGATTTAWNWDFGDRGSSTLQNPTHTYEVAASTSFTVSLTAFVGGQNETTVKTDVITVDPAPLIADFDLTPTQGPNPLLVAFSDSSTGATTTAWNWDFGDGSTSTLQAPTHVYTGPDNYTVSLTVFVGPQSDTVVKTDVLLVDPAPLVVDFEVSSSQGVNPLDVVFTDLSTGATVTAWNWDFGDGSSSTQQNPSNTYQAATSTSFDVTLTASVGQQDETLVKRGFVTVDPAPVVVGFAATPRKGTSPLTVNFTDNTTGATLTGWQWDFGDGSTSTQTNPTHTYVGQASYSVSLTTFVGPQADTLVKPNFITVSPNLFGMGQIVAGDQAFRSIVSADIDGDGTLDVVAASTLDDRIAWFSNSDGQGTFGPEQLITELTGGANSVFAADLDGDGDQDVLSSSYDESAGPFGDSTIAWYENLDGQGSFGPLKPFPSTTFLGVRSVIAADLDGDGDQDVIFSSGFTFSGKDPHPEGRIAWYENTDGLATFGPQQVIVNTSSWMIVIRAADLNADGDLDLFAAARSDSFSSGHVRWYPNLDGLGSFGPAQFVTTSAPGVRSVVAADLDEDGDLDVLSATVADNTIAWYANTNGLGSFGPRQVISSLVVGPQSVFAADLDGDGDQDVLSPSIGALSWFANTDGLGSFVTQQVVSLPGDFLHAVIAADVDGDGDADVISTTDPSTLTSNCGVAGNIAWYANTDGLGALGEQQLITSRSDPVPGARIVRATDLDGDGKLDVLAGSGASFGFCTNDSVISWFRNTDGQGTFGLQQFITTTNNRVGSFTTADLDGDGDQDVLLAFTSPDEVTWFENFGGQGSFPDHHVVEMGVTGAVASADLDGDGDQDALVATCPRITWYENTDGLGTFGANQVVTVECADAILAADLNGDGDLDVLSASSLDDTVAWYENTDGLGSFGPQDVISLQANGAISVDAADLDSDGDLDVLSASFFDDKLAWYENLDGLGRFEAAQIISTQADFPVSILAADADGDGDADVLSASRFDSKIAWYENLDASGAFGSQQIISTATYSAADVFVADLDDDGDLDVLSASSFDDKIAWYENLGPPAKCFLVIGDESGGSPFLGANHLFDTQVGPTIEDSYPVLPGDVPEFVLPSAVSFGVAARGSQGPPRTGKKPPPAWMLDGQFAVQMLKWDPGTYPLQPELFSVGLLVQVQPNGQVTTTPYGTSKGDIQISAVVSTNALGQKVLSFPFFIDGP